MSTKLDVIALHVQGKSAAEIARQLGLNRSDVQAIVQPRTGPLTGPAMTLQERRDRMEQVKRDYADGASLASIALSTGLTTGRVWQIVHDWSPK